MTLTVQLLAGVHKTKLETYGFILPFNNPSFLVQDCTLKNCTCFLIDYQYQPFYVILNTVMH